ncbi:HEXXH motif domain-containing protein [Phytohabitans sp. LJ34]|uniref:HEXXH motif domain-containing protein n=1 Tax=Phytohabitans sp. LJ34 TaxID=3452217 RepID=UPI003F895515
MITFHDLPAEAFAGLASGLGGPAAVRHLVRVQHSKHLLLLRYLADAYSGDPNRAAAVEVFGWAQRRDPDEVAYLMTDPMVGAWAARTTRRLTGEEVEHVGPLEADLAQLGAVAAAAARRTGMDAEIRTRTLVGTVTLPTLGNAFLDSDGPAVVAVSGGQATITAGTTKVRVAEGEPGWRALRRLVARHDGLDGSLALEDTNPYRNCYHAPPADRLPEGDFRRWQELHGEAWPMLAKFVPERAAELAAGLRSVVPLVTRDDGVARSATARDVFGTLGLARPRTPADLAVTLVHEFQHSKLSALLDLVPLCRPDGREGHNVLWRSDARPTGALLQGVYAFLGVADTWRGLRSAPGLEESATREFAFAREQVAHGVAELKSSTELTPAGHAFAEGLRQSVDALGAERVPAPAARWAVEAVERRRRTWAR